jgi:dolichyl-phosphate-mannose-protein mannosyltransferase
MTEVRCRDDLWAIAALLFLGSFAFVRLMALPAFEDEGSQLRWIWRFIEAGDWREPLGEGKPLEAWLMVPLVRLGLPALTVMRSLHVMAGMLGAALTYALAMQVLPRRTAFVCGALFALCPFVVYLQRLALSDMFMCTAGIWVLLSVVRFVEYPAWPQTVMLALGLVLGAICKFPVGFVFLISAPLALLLMPRLQRRSLLRPPGSTRLLIAHTPAVLLALVVTVTAITRVRRGYSPGFGLQDFVGIAAGRYRDIPEVIGVPRANLLAELAAQLSWPVAASGLIGLAAGALLNDWRQRWLIAVGALPMICIGVLAQFWFPRYVLFTLPPLMIAAISGWRTLSLRAGRSRQPVEVGILAICIALMARQSARIILDPAAATWSPLDRFCYFEGWGSGYGYPEAAKFLLAAPDAPRMIYALDGHSAYQLLTYLPAEWRSRVRPVFYGADGRALASEDARTKNLLAQMPVWIIVPQPLLAGYLDSSFGRMNSEQFKLHQIAAFDKPGHRSRLVLYEVVPQNRIERGQSWPA